MWSTGKGTAPPWPKCRMGEIRFLKVEVGQTTAKQSWFVEDVPRLICRSENGLYKAAADIKKSSVRRPAYIRLPWNRNAGVGCSASGMLAPELCGDLDEDLINPASPARWSHRENTRCVCCCRLFRRRRTIRQEAPPFRAPPSRKDVILPETMF